MSCSAILESKLMLVKFDPRLSFFTHSKGVILTMLDKPYMQVIFSVLICMICKAKVIYKVSTHNFYLLVKFDISSTLSSFLNIQNLASSRGFVKISAN